MTIKRISQSTRTGSCWKFGRRWEFHRPVSGPLSVVLGSQYIEADGKTPWDIYCSQRNRQTRILACNIVRCLPEVKPQIEPNSTMEAWLLLISDEIWNDLLRFTNQKIKRFLPGILRESDARNTPRSEIGAFVRLLFMASVLRVSHLNLEGLWATMMAP